MKLGTEQWLMLCALVRDGEPLTPEARAFVADVLWRVYRGEDPRPFAGTMPPAHRPKEPRALVGLHYWILRHKYGKGAELAARVEVAVAWGLGGDRVRKIGSECKAWQPSAAADDGTLLAMCESEAARFVGEK